MAPLNILISGAGIAGNALALLLSKFGHNITVVERYPSLRTSGLQLDLRGHGIEVPKRMELEEAFRAKASPEQGSQVVDSSGRRRAYFPANKSGKGQQGFTSDHEIMRGDFCDLLYKRAKAHARYIFDTSINSFVQRDNIVHILLTDGTAESFDLVVGADGQWSRTRKMMLGPTASDPFHPIPGPIYVSYFSIPKPIKTGEEYIATIYMSTKGRSVLVRRSNPNEIQVYLGCNFASARLQNTRHDDVKGQMDAIAEGMKGAGWQVDEILEAMRGSKNFYCENMGIVKLEKWYDSNVVLVGDAAYGSSGMSGYGTSSSLLGAYILAGEIGKHCADENAKDGLGKALMAYEDKFQPFMTQVQAGLLDDNNWWIMSTSFGIGLINSFLWIASMLKVDIGRWFVRPDIKDWELPYYAELHQ